MVPRIALLVLAAGVVAGTLGACSDEETTDDVLRGAEAGSCLTGPVDSTEDYEAVPCDGEDARYLVLRTLDERLPDDPEAPNPCDEDPSYDYGLSLTQGDPRSLCLQQLAHEGDCVYQGRFIDCEAGGGNKVEAVVEGSTDPADCPNPAQANRVYEGDEPRVVCLTTNLPS